jgi:CRISPR-associated endonuclease Cas1
MAVTTKKVIYCLGYGHYLGVSKKDRTFVLFKDRKIVNEVSFHLCSTIYVSDGNNISSDVLFYAGVYEVQVVTLSQTGRLISSLKSTNADYRVDVRLAQYDALKKPIGVRLAKEILLAKVQTQIEFLERYGLDSSKIYPHIKRINAVKGKNPDAVRNELLILEGNCTKVYFHGFLSLFDFDTKPSRRLSNKHGAEDIFNNVLNLSYEVLKAECFRACYKVHLDPFLGFNHSLKHGKPAFVCDLQDLFRTEINEQLYITREKIDFKALEKVSGRQFLQNGEALKLIKMINDFLDSKRETRIKFGISPIYSRRSIIKYQARLIRAFLTHKDNKLSTL